MVGIQLDEKRDDALAFQRRNAVSYPILFDPKAAAYKQFRRGDLLSAIFPADQVGTPYNVILDRQGVVRYRALGFDETQVRRLVEELLGRPS